MRLASKALLVALVFTLGLSLFGVGTPWIGEADADRVVTSGKLDPETATSLPTRAETQVANACNPCAKRNACNPCASMNACNPCGEKNAHNPCAAKNGCNPCGAMNACNPCGAVNACNPCGAVNACNPCGGAAIDPSTFKKPNGVHLRGGAPRDLLARGGALWNDRNLGKSGIACSTCHYQSYGQMQPSFGTPYPHFVSMPHERAGVGEVSADEMVQFCMLVPMMSEPLDWESQDLAALTAYVKHLQIGYKPVDGAIGNACNPCAMKNACNPCAAKNACNPCAMRH